jgi:hypothetical protein
LSPVFVVISQRWNAQCQQHGHRNKHALHHDPFLCRLALVFKTASSEQLDAKFAAATLCGLDSLAICSNADKRVKRAQKNAPQLVARAKSEIRAKGNVVISIFKRQRFRFLIGITSHRICRQRSPRRFHDGQ